ncbi:hypothetical protein RHSIM_Rhsim05G0032800 [Rhododendron simsii]|uniref:Uncharacterized protein n=1 Tax=Rhododendron simsii TaxID=118357 RepID=A0A834GUK9_RHOSS|nr:hypothetical protein RHSIM_Rhsim05G0032800 [Rhododendron simsii]
MSTRVGTSQGVKECHENPLLGVFGTLSSWLPEDRNSDIVTNLGESTIAMMLKKDPRCCGFKARKYSCLLDPSGTLDPHQIEENTPNEDEVRETPIVFSTIDDTARPTLTIRKPDEAGAAVAGTYETEEEAAIVYNNAAIKLHGPDDLRPPG